MLSVCLRVTRAFCPHTHHLLRATEVTGTLCFAWVCVCTFVKVPEISSAVSGGAARAWVSCSCARGHALPGAAEGGAVAAGEPGVREDGHLTSRSAVPSPCTHSLKMVLARFGELKLCSRPACSVALQSVACPTRRRRRAQFRK